MSLRPIKRIVRAKPTLEGAGVHLRRAFGFRLSIAGQQLHAHRLLETVRLVHRLRDLLAGYEEFADFERLVKPKVVSFTN